MDLGELKEAVAAGEWRRPLRVPEEDFVRMSELQQAVNATAVHDSAGRRPLLEQLLGSIGEDTEVRPPLHVDLGSNIFIGSGCFVNYGLVALDWAPITIGHRAQIASNVQLVPPDHPLQRSARADGWERALPISIGDDVWIGAGAIVVGGVTIGDGAVIGAGAVVTRDVEPHQLALGVPARAVRSLEGEEPPDGIE